MEKINVAVIFGGHTMEYYAGCKAYSSAIANIDAEKFNVIKVGISPEGEWFLTEATADEIRDGESWLKRSDNKPAFFTPVRNNHALMVLEDDGKFSKVAVDVAFPLIAGYGGEDGRIQGMLDMAEIPYVGSGMVSSACGLDKALTRIFADRCGLKQPECVIVNKKDFDEGKLNFRELIHFDYPVFVKPANGGTSVGVTRAVNEQELIESMKEGFKYDDKNLIEEQITGTEIKVAVLGNDEIEFGAICEIEMPEGAINDYETKQTSISKKTIPAVLDKDVEEKIKEQSAAIYKELNCRGFARIDFFLTHDKELYFNEINTVPGLGEKSIYSIMFNKAGVSFKDLLTKLIYTAFE